MSGTPGPQKVITEEERRLDEVRENGVQWKTWGPYLSERQWGTVREDYSENGDAWNYFTHDQARSRAYHWGEDGLAGLSDDRQLLCFSVALWNGNDPILKERLFGLTNGEGNHGEDVKEYYFYLDSTPTHSYMKYLYKYPQSAYPYGDLVETNRQRGRDDLEYELLDTGVFDDDRYFDVFVEYAKASPDGHPDQDQCRAIAGPSGRGCMCCPRCGFATPGPGGRTSRNRPAEPQRKATVSSRSRRRMTNWAIRFVLRRQCRTFCSPRTRPTANGSSARQTDTLRQGWDQRPCRGGQTGGHQPGADRNQGGRALPVRRRRG